MAPQDLKHAIGIFSHRDDAEQALLALRNTGFPMEQISVITNTSEDNQIRKAVAPTLTRTEGATRGAMAGGVGVGLLTLTVGLSILLLPGVGPALAIENLLTAFLASGMAATTGGLYGALQGWLIPEDQCRTYTDRFNQGDYLVLIEATESQILAAEPILQRHGIQMWHVYGSSNIGGNNKRKDDLNL